MNKKEPLQNDVENRKTVQPETRFLITDQVSHNRFDDEVIVVNLGSGTYFSLRDTAVEIWELLRQGPASARSLAAAFGMAETSAVPEIATFLSLLYAEGVIASTEATAQPTSTGATYAKPSLEAFDELRELLLADIVHDTDETGWPYLAKDSNA